MSKSKEKASSIPFRPQKVEVKVKLAGINTVQFSTTNNLGEAFAVVMGTTGNNQPRSVTYHRPIGENPLELDDWVLSHSAEIPVLLSRTVSPYTKAIDEKRRIYADQRVMKKMLEMEYLVLTNDVLKYKVQPDVTRSSVLAKAKIAMKNFQDVWKNLPKERQQPLKGEYPLITTMPTPPDAWFTETPWNDTNPNPPDPEKLVLRIDFFIKEKPIRDAEDAAHRILLDSRERAKRKFPYPPFTTMGGPNADQPQRALQALKGLNLAQAQDLVFRNLGFPSSFLELEKKNHPVTESDDS